MNEAQTSNGVSLFCRVLIPLPFLPLVSTSKPQGFRYFPPPRTLFFHLFGSPGFSSSSAAARELSICYHGMILRWELQTSPIEVFEECPLRDIASMFRRER
ncbi:hypothetical protein SDJN03_20594, partial [Cucurbita argyrosperma subsp. sororia]